MSLMPRGEFQNSRVPNPSGVIGYDVMPTTSADLLDLEADRLRAGAQLQRKYEDEMAQSQAQFAQMMQMQAPGMMGAQQAPFPGMPGMMPQAPFPSMGMQQGPFPGMGMQQGPFPGMGMQQAPFPGMQQAPFPGMGMQKAPFPGMGMQQAPFPGMGMQQAPFPGMGMQQAPIPAPLQAPAGVPGGVWGA